MQISYNWLKQYLPEDFDLSDEELQNKITGSLAEVEGYVKIGKDLKNIVVGEIKQIQPHPKADKLQVATVEVGEKRKRTIVCAAKNIFEGAKVPVALPGGVVLNPKEKLGEQTTYDIKDAELKGVKSSGMLCSQKELGISDDHEGIWILPDEIKAGEDFVETISDTVLEIENKSLTHRSDCFSHLGIAREISAILRTSFDYKEVEESLMPTNTLPFVVKVEDDNLCKRYTAVALQGVKVKESPLWLQLRLLSIGIRPINNIVDATNYVMYDLGQPLHAFDYNKLSSPRVIVRTAKKREKIVTLDGEERKLGSENLLICDPNKAIGIAGVMGGANSEIDDKTKDIIIESANFEMYNNRRTARELGLRTDAATRFEKGLDPELTLSALKKAVQLIIEIAGGEVASEVADVYPEPVTERSLEFETTDVPRLLGIDISKEQIMDILRALELDVQSPEASNTNIQVTAPTFRRDLNIKEDLIEEIARIYGYDKFEPTLPVRDLKVARVNPELEFERKVKLLMTTLGFDEIYTYAFTGEEYYKNTLLDIKDCIRLKNPISPELGYMRSSLIPNLLEKVYLNQENFETLEIFEIARIFRKTKNEEGIPDQPKNLAGIISNDLPDRELFQSLKGKLETLFPKVNIRNAKFVKTADKKYLHSAQQAKVLIEDIPVGYIGIIHPKVTNNWDLKKNTALFILDLERLFEKKKAKKKYRQISKYPNVKRDLSFWADEKLETATILDSIDKVKTNLVKKVSITDVYKSKSKRDKKSVTIQVTLASKKKTLADKEISTEISTLLTALEKIGCKIRS